GSICARAAKFTWRAVFVRVSGKGKMAKIGTPLKLWPTKCKCSIAEVVAVVAKRVVGMIMLTNSPQRLARHHSLQLSEHLRRSSQHLRRHPWILMMMYRFKISLRVVWSLFR